MGFAQSLEDAGVVDAAVAGNGKAALQDSFAEAVALFVGSLHAVGTDVFEVDMADAGAELLRSAHGVLFGKGEVSCVKAEPDIAGIGIVHEALCLIKSLDYGRHMVVEAELETPVSGDFAELVEAGGQQFPLFVRCDGLVVSEHGAFLREQAAGELTDIDAAGADSLEEVKLADKGFLILFVRCGAEEGREPLAGDLDAPKIQGLVEDCRVSRELAADFRSLEARECRFGNHLLKGEFAAELRHIVVGPPDRGDAEFDIVEHSCFYYLRSQLRMLQQVV